jgi:hypothetical protein
MKSQEQIQFESILCKTYDGEYRGAPYRSIGNVIHWIRAFGFLRYDEVTIGYSSEQMVGAVQFFDKLVAFYELNDQLQMPVFLFTEDYQYCEEQQDLYRRCIGKYPDPFEKYVQASHRKTN